MWDTDPTGMCPESVCPQGEDAAKIYSQGAVVTNQYGSWTWTGTSWATNGGVIQAAAPPNTAAQVRDSGWLGRLLYSLGNTVSHWFQAATLTSPDDRVNLDRSVATRKEVQDAFVDGASLIVSGIGGVKTATTVAVETAEVAAEVVVAKGSTSIWSSTSKLSSVKNAFGHWKKHAAEFPEFINAKQYVEGANNFLHNSPAGTLIKTRANGDILKYHPGTNTFGVMDATGVPRTMFRPIDSMKYWLGQ